MNKLIPILLIPLLLGLDVGETSNHQDMLLPFGNAYEEFHKEGCVSITRKKLSPVTQYKANIDTIIISGQVVRITCKRPDSAPSETVGVLISFIPSTVREDGSELLCVSYEVSNGTEVRQTNETEIIWDMKPGDYEVSYQAIDCNGLASGFTDPIQVTVTNP